MGHLGTVMLAGLLILLSETVQVGQVSWGGILFAILLTYRTYAVSDWILALLRRELSSPEARHLRAYRWASLVVLIIADFVMFFMMVRANVPPVQIFALWVLSMIAAALRAFYVEPKRSDKNLGAEVYFLLRFFDAVVWTTFTVGLPLLYLQLPFEIKNAVLWLGMLPMMVVVMFV